MHATTRRVVNEAFAEERASLQALPSAPYRAVLRLERRASHEGMVSVGGNFYGVPDTTRRRVFDVQVLADEICIFEGSVLVQAMLRSKSVARSGLILRTASSPADAAQVIRNQSLSRAPVTTPFVVRWTSTQP